MLGSAWVLCGGKGCSPGRRPPTPAPGWGPAGRVDGPQGRTPHTELQARVGT